MATIVPHPPLTPEHIRAPLTAARDAWHASADAVRDYSVRTLGYVDTRITCGDWPPLLTPELERLLTARHATYARFREAEATFSAERAGIARQARQAFQVAA